MDTVATLICSIVALSGAVYFAISSEKWFGRSLTNRSPLPHDSLFTAYRRRGVSASSVEDTLRVLEGVIGYEGALFRPSDNLVQQFPGLGVDRLIERLEAELDLRNCPSKFFASPEDVTVDDLIMYVDQCRKSAK